MNKWKKWIEIRESAWEVVNTNILPTHTIHEEKYGYRTPKKYTFTSHSHLQTNNTSFIHPKWSKMKTTILAVTFDVNFYYEQNETAK